MAVPQKNPYEKAQRKHICPECEETCKATMFVPAKGNRSIRMNCKNGHSNTKVSCKLK